MMQEIEAVWRIEAPKLIATLTRLTNDLGEAEELAQEAFVAAMRQWPTTGVPRKPGAWLLTVARRRAIDAIRRRENIASKYQLIGLAVRDHIDERELIEAVDHIDDDILRLVFISCHPSLPVGSKVPLALRVLGGLTVAEIAAAFLSTEAAIAARITRAKKTLRLVGAVFEAPVGKDRDARLPDVLEVIYLIFNEGYSASSGDHWMRPALTGEAIRLGAVIANLLPNEPEVHGLLALMRLQASRMGSRVDSAGRPVLLMDQDRGRWDSTMITMGLQSLATAYRLSGEVGPYTIEASIAACHARARRAQDTDWAAIATNYEALRIVKPSPVVDLNWAVAVGKAHGPERALANIDSLLAGPLARYSLAWAARAHFLVELQRPDEAIEAYERALDFTSNEDSRGSLLEQIRLVRERRK